MKKIIGYCAMLLVLGVLLTFNKVSAQANVTGDFPGLLQSGENAMSEALYATAKQAWVAQHAKEYAKMQGVLETRILDDKSFPVFKNTGNPEADNAAYAAAKAEWIAAHPAEYNSAAKNTAVEKIQIDKADFDRLFEETRKEILANPDKYEVVVNLNANNTK